MPEPALNTGARWAVPETVLVTGAGSGIGAAIATLLARQGAAVAVNDLDGDRAEATVSAIRAEGHAAHPVPGDVSLPDPAQETVDRAIGALGSLQGLVNNVGIVRPGSIASGSLDDWEAVMRTDLDSVLCCTRAAAEALALTAGAIVNISSLVALAPVPGAGSYSVAKAAVVTLTQQTALEWGPLGIRANAVAPGVIGGTRLTSTGFDTELATRRGRIIPLRRIGAPDDIADVVSFLLSDAARYITGQLIVVDGGLSVALQTFIPAGGAAREEEV